MDTLIAAAPYLVVVLLVAVAIFAFRHGRVTGIASVIKADAPAVEADVDRLTDRVVTSARAHLPGLLAGTRNEIGKLTAEAKQAIDKHFALRSSEVVAVAVPAQTQPKETSTVQPLTGLILFQLMVVIATGQHDAALEAQLGGQYNAYKNQYGPGGPWYVPELVMEAGRASGLPQFWPPRFAWVGYQQRGYGSVQGDKWVWNANLLGPFATYYKP